MPDNNGPSKHLTWSELACKDGTVYPLEWRTNRAIQLAEVFELIRSMCDDRPIKILSAYRSKLHNKLVGGAVNSQHLQGRALDLRPPVGYTVKEFYEIIKTVSRQSAIGGIGLYKTFVHVDIRPKVNGRVAFWTGNGMKDDLG